MEGRIYIHKIFDEKGMKMVFKKEFMIVLVLLMGLAGCGGKKGKKVQRPKGKRMARRMDSFSQVDMQLAGDQGEDIPADETVRSFFDQDSDEFVLLTPDEEETAAGDVGVVQEHDAGIKADEFAWVDAAGEQDQEYGVINFGFDEARMHRDQKNKLSRNITKAQELLKETKENDAQPTIVLEGHACSSAGSKTYNIGLSEKRAKEVADCFTKVGVSVKIVGRGSEVPVIVDDKPVGGDREQQAPNRRVEMHVVYS